MNWRHIAQSFVAVTLLVGTCGYAQTDEENILSALSNVERAADPQQDRTVLVYSRASNLVHESIPTVNLMLKLLGEETGAFTAVFNNEEQEFTPEYLQQFDMVFFNNTTFVELAFTTAAQRSALLDYVRNGGGWGGLHAATDAGGEAWMEYTRMVGGQFDSHPWNSDGTWPVIVEDPGHPIVQGFSRTEFTLSDEIHMFQHYDRSQLRVLMSLNADETSLLGRPDNDHPIVWVKEYGEGRVFYSSLGHNTPMFFDSEILQHYLYGIQFALGDLEVDTTSLPMPERQARIRREPVPILTPDQQLGTFELKDGYFLELVVSDPEIAEPVVAAFDGDGKMYVAEMRTYMQDIDGNDQFAPTSRVSLHEDTDGDGRMDKHSVYVDDLVLPRIILPLDDRVVIGTTNTLDLYAYRDTDGDGVADEREPFFIGGPFTNNLEHQPNGLIWSLDNWLYSTFNAFRLRYNIHGGETIRENTPANRGQFGLGQDNNGKVWFIHAGSEIGPTHFQVPIVYGAVNVENQVDPGYRIVWPIDDIPDAEGGTGRLRPDNTLNHFTATSGSEIFRGDRLPEELFGNLFFGEPVGRLVRRSTVTVEDGITKLANAYEAERSEFIASTDAFFRPVNMVTAPDGTLYIVDMYRGIIQEGTWMQPDSYLYGVVQQYGLDRNFGRGRIWRVRHEDFEPGPKPNMLSETPAQLVEHLDHPNGWWRDTAQKLIALKADKSVVPRLRELAGTADTELGRIHAIWTLEGLEEADADVIRAGLADESPNVRRAAIRAGESLFLRGDASLTDELFALFEDSDPEVAIQAMLTARYLELPNVEQVISANLASTSSAGVREIVGAIDNLEWLDPGMPAGDREFLTKGKLRYDTLCFACHGSDGTGQPVGGSEVGTVMAPSFVESELLRGHPDPLIAIVLHGLTGNSGEGKEFLGLMVPMDRNSDEYIASSLSYIRYVFAGGTTSLIAPEDVARVREATADRTTPLTPEDLQAMVASLAAE